MKYSRKGTGRNSRRSGIRAGPPRHSFQRRPQLPPALGPFLWSKRGYLYRRKGIDIERTTIHNFEEGKVAFVKVRFKNIKYNDVFGSGRETRFYLEYTRACY
jgi:hypothetical protein